MSRSPDEPSSPCQLAGGGPRTRNGVSRGSGPSGTCRTRGFEHGEPGATRSGQLRPHDNGPVRDQGVSWRTWRLSVSYSAARLSSRGWSRPGSACNALAAIESSGLPKDRVEKYPPAIVLAARLRYQPNAAGALVGEVMRPNSGHPYHLAITFEEDRHRDEERRHERHRAMLESRAESPSLWASSKPRP